MSINKILDNIANRTLSELLGKKEVAPVLFMGNGSKTLCFKLPLTNDINEKLLAAEFVRYSVMKELFTYVTIVSPARMIRPSVLSTMSDNEIAQLSNPQNLLNHPSTESVLQFTLETPKEVHMISYELISGFNDLIINLKAIQETAHSVGKEEVQFSGPMNDFFSGMKTSIIQNDPSIIRNFDEKLENLKSGLESKSSKETRH